MNERDREVAAVRPKRKPRKAFTVRNKIPADRLSNAFKVRARFKRPLQPAVQETIEEAYPLVPFRSSRPDVRLQHEVTDTLERLQLGQTWLGFMPMLIGRHKALDHATKAFVSAHAFAVQKHLGSADADIETCLIPYGNCIREVRGALSEESGKTNDEILLSVMLLANFESTTQFKRADSSYGKWLPHTHGVHVLLMDRDPVKAESDIVRTIFSAHSIAAFSAACAYGVASPFDVPGWRQLKVATRTTWSSDTLRMSDIAQKLSIRLPALIVMVRNLLAIFSSAKLAQAAQLANELLKLVDEAAETAILHRVNIRKTQRPADAVLAPFSMYFNTAMDFEACIYYWQLRLLLLRLHQRITVARQQQAEYPLSESLLETQAEVWRLAKNIAMSWEYGYDRGQFGRVRLSLALPILWGGMMDFETFGSLSRDDTRLWISQRFDLVFLPRLPGDSTSIHELDLLAELLVGGELRGAFVHVFRTHWMSIMRPTHS